MKPLLHENHPRPITRRDFLAQGFLDLTGLVLAPTIAGLLIREARAGIFPAAEPQVPFLVFDLAGGAGLSANFLVGKAGGPEDLLKSYDELGWDPREAGALDASFGLPMAARVSGILRGMRQVASAQALAGLRMGSICHFSRDDTSANRTSAITLAAKAGPQGSAIANFLGVRNSASGGNTQPAVQELLLKPLVVQSVFSVSDAVSFGPAFSDLTAGAVSKLARTLSELSASQARKYLSMDNGKQLAELSGAAYGRNIEIVGSQIGDPRQDAVFQQVYGINPGTAPNAREAVSATIVSSVLLRISGPGVLTIGGCDYHDGTQTTGDNKDTEIGVEIGRAVEAAYRLKTPLFFEVLSDGGVYPRKGTRIWQGDAGDKSLTVLGYFHPDRPAKIRKAQVGHYTDGQAAEQRTLIGSDSAKVGLAAFANYLGVCGRLAEFEKYAPRGVFSRDELDWLQVFEA